MTHALHDPVRHNAWATTQILEFCQGLDEQTLNATVPGTYGTIIATLRHIIGQICTILGALGHEPPDLTPWGYAFASGRIRE
jgi:uncharacterized damage-inducible protein DinB